MKTTTEIREELREAKIGRGCKFILNANCVTIIYPTHRTESGLPSNPYSHKGSQKDREDQYVLSNYSMDVNPDTLVHRNGKTIQIYLNN